MKGLPPEDPKKSLVRPPVVDLVCAEGLNAPPLSKLPPRPAMEEEGGGGGTAKSAADNVDLRWRGGK